MIARRTLLKASLGFSMVSGPIGAAQVALAGVSARRLVFNSLHTGETLNVVYWENGAYLPEALSAVNHVLRDHRTGEVHDIDPRLLDLLTALSVKLETAGRYSVISGYRSPLTNAALHAESRQVASGSLHLKGQAIDIRMAGIDLNHVHNAALDLGVGGVGYYPTSDFVHVDVGRVRRWSGT